MNVAYRVQYWAVSESEWRDNSVSTDWDRSIGAMQELNRRGIVCRINTVTRCHVCGDAANPDRFEPYCDYCWRWNRS